MPSFNHSLFDSYVSRAIDLQKLTASLRNKALGFLRKLEQDLVVELAKADLPGYQINAAREARMRAMLGTTQSTISQAYKDINRAQQADFKAFASAESQFVQKSINDLAGVELATQSLSTEQLNAIASNTLIQGAPSAAWWSRQSADSVQRFSDTVRLGVAQGHTNDEITSAVRKNVTVAAGKNAEVLVRTSVQAISGAARLASFAENDDVIDAIQQHSTLDGRTTLICIAYSGQRYTNDEDHKPLDKLPFVNEGGSPNGIPRHWGCLTGDSLIASRNPISTVSKRWFDGEVVVIKTAANRVLRCTPNHPIFTSLGWIAAGVLNVGGDVICDRWSEWKGISASHHEAVPTRIEDVASAFFATSEVITMPVPLAAKDFYGDGVEGEVAVVATYRHLLVAQYASFLQQIEHELLVAGRAAATVLVKALCHESPFFRSTLSTADSTMCGGYEVGAPFGIGPVHACLLLRRSIAENYASGAKKIFGEGLTAAELFHEPLDTDPRLICGDDLFADRIVELKRTRFASHVYDLDTGGFFSANTIVTHNCRSYWMPVVKSWAAMGAQGIITGGRPAQDVDAYFRSRLKARGFTDAQADAVVRNAQASMDGQVPETMNYEQWLKTKPEAFQREQLGASRYNLWKKGKLSFTDLVDRSGEPMTVEDLLKKTA